MPIRKVRRFQAMVVVWLLNCCVAPPIFADDASTTAPAVQRDWRWVKGAVFVPTNAVNEAQMWDEYDPGINDRELHHASIYGINCVRVYLHYFIYLKKKDALLNDIEDFLTRADKYHIKTELVFFDDCWHEPSRDILSADYHYPAPIPGVHNSRWLKSPGDDVLTHYPDHRDRLKAYVQDIVNAHRADPRIAFWETYNEPRKKAPTEQLEKDAQQWIHETGSLIPVTATGGEFSGDAYSDFETWHQYSKSYRIRGSSEALNTECMCRPRQSIPGIVEHFAGKTGFIIWEFGIGRDNCRFAWQDKEEHPHQGEATVPFHGMVYPDGHPWSVDDAVAMLGRTAFDRTPFFKVAYFSDDHFNKLAKESISPMIDFDLPDESGCGSPDATAGIGNENFSERWTGKIVPPQSGEYALTVDTDGKVTVAVDGKTIIEKNDQQRGKASGKVTLDAAGGADITVQYVHGTGGASLHVSWSGPGLSQSQPMTPAIPGSSKAGP